MKQITKKEYTSLFKSRKAGVRASKILYEYYLDNVDFRNSVSQKKTDVAKALNVTTRTISNYIKTLCNLQLIKYKYSGITRLNPIFFYNGKEEDYKIILREYENFESDIGGG